MTSRETQEASQGFWWVRISFLTLVLDGTAAPKLQVIPSDVLTCRTTDTFSGLKLLEYDIVLELAYESWT